jgi:hypothetical protein
MAGQTQRGKGFGKALTFFFCSLRWDLGNSLTLVSPYKPQTLGSPLTLWVHHRTEDWDSSLTSQLDCVSGSHFHILLHSTILPPCSLNLRDTASPQQVVTSSFWEVINLPFCLLSQTWIWTQVLTVQRALLLSWFLRLSGFHSAFEAFTLTHREDKFPPPDQAVHWHLVGSPPSDLGDAPQWQGK